MNSWTIYGKNGVAKAEVNELELHDEWMAECFLTVSVKSAEPIDFAVDDYIDYRGERYAIQYDPTLLKKARRDTYGEGFVYDNIKFVNEAQAKIVRCDFNDIVLNDNELHYTSLPTFPFYCESVDDLLDRILANLEDLYPGEFTIIGLNTVRNKQRADITHNTRYVEEYKKWIDPTFTPNTEPYGKQGVAETVDNINCWNALAKVHEDFELNFIVRGYTIIVGTVGVFTANKFRYGKGNGLYEIERISDSEQQIVTRLRSYGASTNLPTRYYATLNTQVFGTVTQISANTTYASFLLDLNFSTKYFNYRSESYPGTNEFPNYIVRIMANNHTVKGYVTKDYTTGACSVYCESSNPQEDDRDEPDAAELVAFAQSLSVGTRVYFVNYVEKGAFDSAHTDYATENLPDNMAVSRLMLPGFPNQSLYDWAKAHRDENTPYDDTKGICTINGFTAAFSKDKYRPYIDSPNADDYGIRPASFYFDGSGDNEDIHPTIEGMTYNNQPIDVIYAADQVADNGVYAEGKSPDPIFITLPVLGFELDQVWKDDASIEMKDGMCGGRSLKIVSKPVKIDGGYWKCKVERVKDESLDLWFPYNDFQIHSGDHYVLVGIDMPDAYVTAASERLFYASLTALQENHAPRFTYQPRIDEVWMQRQHDRHLVTPAITSLHDTLKSGDIFSFADTDMAIDANIIIDVLTIKENGNNGIPTYEITLRDEKQVSPIQKIQNKVDTLSSGSYNGNTGGSGFSGRQIQSLIENEGNTYFLSKLNDDEAAGVITFLKGIWIKAKELFGITEEGDARLRGGDFSGNVNIAETLNVEGQVVANWMQSTEYTGDGMMDKGYKLWYDEGTGRAKLVIDDLVARGKFTVNELESRIWTYAGGNMVFSGAGSTIFFVEYLDANDNVLGYTNINAPWLLAGRPLLSAMVAWSKRRKVQRSLTDAEKAQVVKFRCYEYSDNGTMQTRNWWHTDDLAFCQTLNHVKDKINSDGSYSGSLSNTVYHRLVKTIGTSQIAALDDGQFYDYVELSNISGEYDPTYNDWPAAGDTIVQRGNRTDSSRRSMVTIEVTGDTRGLKVYDKIMGWYADTAHGEHPNGIRYTYIGYDESTGRAKLEALGDAYIGSADKTTTYVKFDEALQRLDIKARIDAQSTMPYNGSDAQLINIFNGLSQQIDGKIETWQQESDPASAWTTADEKAKHVGDLWMDTSANGGKKTYIYKDKGASANPRYDWVQQDVPQVVFDDIDGKASVYSEWNAWGEKLHLRDLLIPSLDIDRGSGVVYKAGKVYRCTQVTPPVFSEVSYTDDTRVEYYMGLLAGGQSPSTQDKEAALAAEAAIRGALGAGTIVDGGLLLTTLIGMRQYKGSGDKRDVRNYTTWAGISGEYNASALGTGIAAWYGGDMIDYDTLTDAQKEAGWGSGTGQVRYAKSLLRQDGTGYFASGKVRWDANGDGSVANGNISWTTDAQTGKTVVTLNGDVVKAANYYLNGDDITQQLQNLFDMFEKVNVAAEGQTPYYMIHAKLGIYADGDLQALGYDPQQGGGGGGASVLYELNDVSPNAAHNAVLGIIIDDQNPQGDGYVLTYDYNSKHWIAAPAAETYHLPQATSRALGGIKIGYTPGQGETRNYAVVLDNDGKAYVNVPWSGGTQSDWDESDSSSLAYIKNKPTIPTVPTNISDFTNDSGYITSSGSCSYASSAGGVSWSDVSGRPTAVSSFTNDIGYITSSGSCNYANSAGYASSAGSAGSAGSADYATSAGSGNIPFMLNGATNNLPRICWHIPNVCWCNIAMDTGGNLHLTNSNSVTSQYNSLTVGYLYAQNDVQVTSDERDKDVIGDVELTVEQIAKMPSVLYKWKDKRDDLVHVGTLAQSWEGVLPQAVGIKNNKMKTRSFSYSSAAYAMAHADACEIVALKKRVSELEAELKRYKSA